MRNKTMKYKYYLFDLDGTLTDSGIGITNSVMYALEKFGIHVSDRKELYPFIGPPLTDSFRKYFSFTEQQALQAVEYYREYFRAGGIFENAVYEGIPEMLGELKGRNAIIALATSKPYEFTVQILDHFDLHKYFDHVGAATMDGHISKKADVIRHLLDTLEVTDKSSVLMIGDRDQDIEGAKTNDLHSAGVLWGYGSNEELMNAGADYIASEPSDILSL
jgi:phosphoglycolate phosphatase